MPRAHHEPNNNNRLGRRYLNMKYIKCDDEIGETHGQIIQQAKVSMFER